MGGQGRRALSTLSHRGPCSRNQTAMFAALGQCYKDCSLGLSMLLDTNPIAQSRTWLPNNPTISRLHTSQCQGAHYLTGTLVLT